MIVQTMARMLMAVPAFRSATLDMLGAYQSNFYAGVLGGGTVGRNEDLTRTKAGAMLAYRIILPVFRSVQLRSQAVSAIPWKIIRNLDDQVVASSTDYTARHPLARMFLNASRWHNESLFYLWEMALSLYGENYIEKCMNRFQVPAGLRWLNPLAIQANEAGGRVLLYQYLTAGGSKSFRPDQLSFDRIPDPGDDLHGYGPTYAALEKINVDNNAHRWWAAHFRNGARVDTNISPDGTFKKSFTEDDQKILEDSIRQFSKGVDQAGRTRVWPYPMKIETADPVDLSKQIPLSDAMETAIYAGYGVNRQAAGDMTNVRYKTDVEVLSSFYGGVIAQECKGIEAETNSTLMPFAEQCEPDACEHRFLFDLSAFDSLTEGEKTRREEARADLAAGAITLNEFRRQAGQPEKPEGEVYFVPSGVTPRRPEELVSQPTPPDAPQSSSPFTPPQVAPAPAIAEPSARAEIASTQGDHTITEQMAAVVETVAESLSPGYVTIDFVGQPDLLQVQDNLRAVFGDQLEYQDPAELHLTLVYGDSLSVEQMAAGAIAEPMADTIILTSNRLILLGGENGDPVALCAEIIPVPELLALQREVYNLMVAAGAALSDYSRPESFRPHITLATVPQGAIANEVAQTMAAVKAEFTILARQVVGQRDEYKAVWAFPLPTAGYENWRRKARQANAMDELRAWEKAVVEHKMRRAFDPIHTRGDLSDWITEQLTKAHGERTAVRGVFAEARKRLEYRAITDTETAFGDDFYSLLETAVLGDSERRQWAAGVRRIIRQYGLQAYRDGLVDGGVDDDQLSDDDQLEASDLIRSQSEYVTGLGAKLFSEGLTMAEIANKPDMWTNKTLTPFYTAGLASANRNQMMEFAGEDGDESCDTCQRLKGQRHRIKDWRRRGMVPREDTDNFTCGGWRCVHTLVPVSGKARGTY